MLTPKQENFCLVYIETGNASEAYRQSYDAGGSSEAAINVAASKLLDNPKVVLRLAEIRKPALERAQITLEVHLNDLKRLRDKAEDAEKFGPAVAAEISRGKASGLYIEKVEQTGPNGGPQQHEHKVVMTAEESYRLMLDVKP